MKGRNDAGDFHDDCDCFSFRCSSDNHGEHRTGMENNWFALTGRVVVVKVEAVRNIERQEPI